MPKRLVLISLFLLGIGFTGLKAQESVNAAGGNSSGTGGSVSYSFGQFTCQTHTGSTGSVIEGVQQPYEISVITSIENSNELNLSVTAYPNPSRNFLILNIEEFNGFNLSYQLHDMQGKLLQSQKISGNQAIIVLSNLMPSTYFLKVIQDNKEIKSFKIIKF